ncbi:dihydroneopterin aldolase [Geosporobacter subterraneus DSM 17957]|uniref:7,8-dihydroneopterin aldolase n=1 Tax=Geosporobacter subterraneus DSM 17957 TaxID=1121919 RepID=A0A1M6H6L6_9FIRM|nr:dihydroneopterin aldolase [Geosporobacter subterraneus]SHJ17763.1 dihydroneopterin aldolase [Geosporobacter subterraneus DSM 17957]
MDKIIMKNLGFYGYHGVLPEENRLGQKFFLDIELFLDLAKAGGSDSVVDTVNYAEVYEIIKETVENKRFQLIEALGESIAKIVLQRFEKIVEIVITIRKPEAPVPGIYDYFGIEIRRNRNG